MPIAWHNMISWLHIYIYITNDICIVFFLNGQPTISCHQELIKCVVHFINRHLKMFTLIFLGRASSNVLSSKCMTIKNPRILKLLILQLSVDIQGMFSFKNNLECIHRTVLSNSFPIRRISLINGAKKSWLNQELFDNESPSLHNRSIFQRLSIKINHVH